MQVLVVLIISDIILGILCGYVFKDLNSRVGLVGIIKHSVVILLVMLFDFISRFYGVVDYFKLFLIFYYIQYTISILENAYCLGVPIPKFIVKRLKDYQEKEGLEQWEK